MAFTSMHFAVGMACTGAAATVGCILLRRGWRLVPPLMTVGGIWAIIPDLPRMVREDFPSMPLATLLGDRQLEDMLLSNLFFFHRSLDLQPKEYAIHGLALILLLYNLGIALLLVVEYRQSNRVGNRRCRARRDRWRKEGRHAANRSANPNPIDPPGGPIPR